MKELGALSLLDWATTGMGETAVVALRFPRDAQDTRDLIAVVDLRAQHALRKVEAFTSSTESFSYTSLLGTLFYPKDDTLVSRRLLGSPGCLSQSL